MALLRSGPRLTPGLFDSIATRPATAGHPRPTMNTNSPLLDGAMHGCVCGVNFNQASPPTLQGAGKRGNVTSTRTDKARALIIAWRKGGRAELEKLLGKPMNDDTWPALEAQLRETFPNG